MKSKIATLFAVVFTVGLLASCGGGKKVSCDSYSKVEKKNVSSQAR